MLSKFKFIPQPFLAPLAATHPNSLMASQSLGLPKRNFAGRASDWMSAETDFAAMEAAAKGKVIDMFDSQIDHDARAHKGLGRVVGKYIGEAPDQRQADALTEEIFGWYKAMRKDWMRGGIDRLQDAQKAKNQEGQGKTSTASKKH